MGQFFKNNAIYALCLAALAVFAYMDFRYLDLELLAATGGDEFMQYHSLLRMKDGIANLSVEDLFRFDSYVYGFVWHLLSLAAAAPFHALGDTQMAIFAPRFLSGVYSVLCLFMVFKIARMFLGYFYSYALVLLLASMAGFWHSGYIFKPDVFQGLLLLVCAYFLLKDSYKFGRDFYLGVLFYGLAVGAAKIQAVMFLPLIYLYILAPFLQKPSAAAFALASKRGFWSTLAIVALFVATNPYILHPRGFGAWLGMFLLNMQSNVTNHGSYVDVSLADKIWQVVDFYYFNVLVFALIVGFGGYFVWKFLRGGIRATLRGESGEKSTQRENNGGGEMPRFAGFFPIFGAALISVGYLFLFVNKTWSNYYVSTILLLVVGFVALFAQPFFAPAKARILALGILALQMGGGGAQSFLSQGLYKIQSGFSPARGA